MRATLFLFFFLSGTAGAYSFHGVLGDGFSALYPRSLEVAFAVHDTVEQKIMEPESVQGPAGYMRTVLKVNALQRRLASLAVPTSLQIIDSGLWTQLEPLAVHAAGPRPGDGVILTSEPVLAALLDGRLPAAVALERKMTQGDS